MKPAKIKHTPLSLWHCVRNRQRASSSPLLRLDPLSAGVAEGASAQKGELSADSAIHHSVRWRSHAFALLTPRTYALCVVLYLLRWCVFMSCVCGLLARRAAVQVDNEVCARVLVWKDSGSVAAVSRARLLRPFQLSFSHPFAAIYLPRLTLPSASASAASSASSPTPAFAESGSGGSLLLTRKTGTALYTSFQPPPPSAAASALPLPDYSTEPEEVSLLNHGLARWGPYIIRSLPSSIASPNSPASVPSTPTSSTSASASASAPRSFAPTTLSLVVDRPSHNASRALTTTHLRNAFEALGEAVPELLRSAPLTPAIHRLIVAYVVVYPVVTPFTLNTPFYLYFDQIAVCRRVRGVTAPNGQVPTICIEVLNAGARGAATNTEGVIRVRVGTATAPTAPASDALAASDDSGSTSDAAAAFGSSSDSAVAAAEQALYEAVADGSGVSGAESVSVTPSLALTDEHMDCRDVTAAGLNLKLAVSIPYYQTPTTADASAPAPIAPHNNELHYPYVKVMLTPASDQLKRALVAAASGEAAVESAPAPAVPAAVLTAQRAVEREVVDDDDVMSKFRKKKNVDKKEAREIVCTRLLPCFGVACRLVRSHVSACACA